MTQPLIISGARSPRRLTTRLLMLAILSIITATTLLDASVATADTLSLRLGGSDAAVTDDSYDFLNSDDSFLSMGHLAAHATFIPNLWIGLEYAWGFEQATPAAGMATEFDIDGLYLSARGQYEVLPFLSPYVSFGGGFHHITLNATIGDEEREQTRVTPAFTGFVGAELHVPRTWLRRIFKTQDHRLLRDLTVGIIFEGGYQWTGTAKFDELARPDFEREPEPEDRPLDANSVRLGEVDLSGVILRSALVVRF